MYLTIKKEIKFKIEDEFIRNNIANKLVIHGTREIHELSKWIFS